MSRLSYITAAAALVALGASAAHAQDPVKWMGTPASKTVAPGGKTTIKLNATIEDGWHIYSLTQGPGGPVPTRITMPKEQEFAIDGTAKGAPPESKFDQNFGITVETYESKAEFTVPIVANKDAKTGEQTAQVAVRYQVCNASMCLPAKTEKVAVALDVKGKAGK